MAKKKKPTSGEPPAPVPPGENEAAAQRRVALLRHKLTRAMDDPLTRDQIVKAIRSMMADGR